MGKGKKFDKKSAKTYSVVHRAHDDELYFDNDVSAQVLVEKPQKRASTRPGKAVTIPDLVETLNSEGAAGMRDNEGLAAQYGIFFDDSKYDYMQHLRPIGQAPDSVFIEAPADKAADKSSKAPKNIEDLIKDVLPSQKTRKVTHDEYDSIPDELKRFNPEMDPRLREVLVALEDEAYVENDSGEGDIFDDLLRSGQAEDGYYEGASDDDEWDMDNYQDDFEDFGSDYEPEQVELENPYNAGEAPEGVGAEAVVDNAWEKDFQRFERARKNQVNEWDSDNDFDSDGGDVVGELPAIEAKKKPKNKLRKKMGAMTDTSAFSMSSSALFRSEGLTLLDDRFESYAKKFEEEEPEEEKGDFDMAQERPDFEDMLDDFLDTYELESGGRKLAKKDQELDKIKLAADSVSKGKAAQRRKRDELGGLGSSFGKLQL